MNDDDLLRELRSAARREEDMPVPDSLSAPLDPAFHARVVGRIRAEKGGVTAKSAAVVRFPRQAVAVGVTIVALAAGIALFVRPSRTTVADLPEYAMALSGAEHDLRGTGPASVERPRYRANSPLTLVLRPPKTVEGDLEIRTARRTSVGVEIVEVPHRLSSAGAVAFEASAGDVFGSKPGEAELFVVIARKGAMPADWLDRATRGESTDPGVRVIRARAEIVAY